MLECCLVYAHAFEYSHGKLLVILFPGYYMILGAATHNCPLVKCPLHFCPGHFAHYRSLPIVTNVHQRYKCPSGTNALGVGICSLWPMGKLGIWWWLAKVKWAFNWWAIMWEPSKQENRDGFSIPWESSFLRLRSL